MCILKAYQKFNDAVCGTFRIPFKKMITLFRSNFGPDHTTETVCLQANN